MTKGQSPTVHAKIAQHHQKGNNDIALIPLRSKDVNEKLVSTLVHCKLCPWTLCVLESGRRHGKRRREDHCSKKQVGNTTSRAHTGGGKRGQKVKGWSHWLEGLERNSMCLGRVKHQEPKTRWRVAPSRAMKRRTFNVQIQTTGSFLC